jgi:PST family polysaccharide transporter
MSNTEKTTSYGNILRSSTILGGSQVLVYLISMARTKVAAVLLGPSGVGTLAMFQTILSLIGTVSSLGIGNSGVREIAEANGSGDVGKVGRTCATLHRIVLVTGVLGWLLAAALAYPISKLAFGDHHHSGAIILLGSCLLLGAVGTSYAAILQGTRRIGSLAKFQVTANALGAICAIGLYIAYGTRGIVPSIIAAASVNCGLTFWMRKRAMVALDPVGWRDTFRGSRTLVAMGVAFMWNAVSTGLVAFGTRAFVVRYEGLEAAGIFQAAWAISGLFAGFILQAMGTDFYPRLTAAADDKAEMGKLINEQTEIGVLLAGPGILLTLCFAPYLMEWLYSAKFIAGTPLILWFALGVFGQVISWPLGFIQIAKGASRAFIATQTLFNGVHFGLVTLLFHGHGMVGIGMAYAALYALYTVSMLVYARHLIGFRWSGAVIRLVLTVAAMVAAGFFLALFNRATSGTISGLALACVGGFLCCRELVKRLPGNNRLAGLLRKIPGMPSSREIS